MLDPFNLTLNSFPSLLITLIYVYIAFDDDQQAPDTFDMSELNNLFAGMQDSGVDPMQLLQSLMSGVGEGEEGEQFMDMMQQFMSAINPEEIARASTQQMITMYEDYLAAEKEVLPAEEYKQYEEQLNLHRQVLELIDRQASEEEFQELGQRMNFSPESIPAPIREQLEQAEQPNQGGDDMGPNPCAPQ